MIDPKDVQTKLDKLVALGTTDAIALEMEAQGIKARRVCPFSCVVAQYLGNSDSRFVQGRSWVAVSGASIYIDNDDTNPDFPTATIPTPPLVRAFVQRFDKNDFPELVSN